MKRRPILFIASLVLLAACLIGQDAQAKTRKHAPRASAAKPNTTLAKPLPLNLRYPNNEQRNTNTASTPALFNSDCHNPHKDADRNVSPCLGLHALNDESTVQLKLSLMPLRQALNTSPCQDCDTVSAFNQNQQRDLQQRRRAVQQASVGVAISF